MPLSVASTSVSGRNHVLYTNHLARTDTAAKDLFVLEAGDIPISLSLHSDTASDAGTGAIISIGSTGNAAYFAGGIQVISGVNAILGGVSAPSTVSNLMVPLAFQTTVTGIYAEYGTASTEGGPWTVMMEVLKS